jgi:hypothetical protein
MRLRYCKHRQTDRKAYLHRDVSNEHTLVIQKIFSHLYTKNDEVVELMPPQSRAPPQISLFE